MHNTEYLDLICVPLLCKNAFYGFKVYPYLTEKVFRSPHSNRTNHNVSIPRKKPEHFPIINRLTKIADPVYTISGLQTLPYI